MKFTSSIVCVLTLVGLTSAQAKPKQDNTLSKQKPTSRPVKRAEVRRPAKLRQGGFLGLYITEVLDGDRSFVEIVSVLEGSDAERAGFRAGDRVLGVKTKPSKAMRGRGRAQMKVRNGDNFIMGLWSSTGAAKGATTVAVERDGKRVDIVAGMAELDIRPRVGDKAPDFTLKSPDGKQTVTLSKLIGKKPVVLVFGSYT